MKKYLQIINIRTFQVLLICFVTSFFVIYYKIEYNFDLTVISIAIIFPLVFTIRAAFRRREKALEHLSRLKSALTTVHHCFLRCKKLDDAKRAQIQNTIQQLSDDFHNYLGKVSKDESSLRAHEDAIFQFIMANKEEVGGSEAFKIFRFMKDVHASIENLVAIDSHRTPISLRAYCKIFIYFFPIIYTPALLHRLDDHNHASDWVVYSLSMVTGFILISLFNVQDEMEHPFDQKGLDDIQLDKFKLKL
ncbi:MAG TPA: hypothetical protein PLR06_01090 [Cyclobacteriaceae bacterium]|nr:hypothetical protein [Cyclobacteriaceae bacterium]